VPRRIFYLITELDAGGAERALLKLATAMKRAGDAVKVACLTGEGQMAEPLRQAGIEVFFCHMRQGYDLPAMKRLVAELRRWRPDVLHGFLFHANLVGRIAGRVAGVPFVLNSVRVEEPRRSHRLLDRLTYRLMDLEVCVSESARRFTARTAGVPDGRLEVVPNGVDLEEFDPIPPTPEHWGLGKDEPVVATVGRLTDQKDPYTLLCAARIVLRQHPATRFVIAGEGPLRGTITARSRDLGISHSVLLLGQIPDTRPLLARCDVFALTSRWEGMPNALLEAMACRRPVVATRVGGCEEVVEEGVNGYLVPPRHARALADRLLELLRDPAKATAMGEAGRRTIEQRYTLRQTLDGWRAIYDRASAVISKRRSGPRWDPSG
jgi:glycosyltransferase involved in cell wall biosynthesis